MMSDLVICTDPTLQDMSYNAYPVWEHQRFRVLTGNRGQYMIVLGTGPLEGLELRGTGDEMMTFLKLLTDDDRIGFVTKRLMKLMMDNNLLMTLLDRAHDSGMKKGRNEVRAALNEVMRFE
jgi:hypothetical protein